MVSQLISVFRLYFGVLSLIVFCDVFCVFHYNVIKYIDKRSLTKKYQNKIVANTFNYSYVMDNSVKLVFNKGVKLFPNHLKVQVQSLLLTLGGEKKTSKCMTKRV